MVRQLLNNKFLKRALGLVVLALVLVGVVFALRIRQERYSNSSEAGSPDASLVSTPVHKLIYYEPQSFFEGVTQVRSSPLPDAEIGDSKISGGIIPHHLLPGYIYSDFFTRLQQQKPKRIILIGPNHKEKGGYKVLTSLQGWQTPFGVVESDVATTQKFINAHAAYVDEPVVEDEHSVAGMMPYIKFYLPDARVVPLVLRSTITSDEARNLAKQIAENVDADTVVIAPVDFSHYLTADQAQAHDIITLDVMQGFDYTSLFAMSNAYVDSPPSIAVFLMAMQDIKTVQSKLIYNTNSGVILHDNFIKTTSYFSIIYH